MHLTQMFVHPLKSGRGIAYSRAFAAYEGLLHDREWLLVDEKNQFMTARTFPQMVKIEIELIPGGALFKFPGMSPMLALPTLHTKPVETSVWKDDFVAWEGDPRADEWFSQALGLPCKLLWLGRPSARAQKTTSHPLSFADGYPYLLINQASVEEVNEHLATPVTARNFRPNLVIEGATAYEEDEWKRVRIGSVEFAVAKPCTRCILTTVDPERGEKRSDNEPLKTLASTRKRSEGICFGLNLVAINEGIVNIGDEFEVLETNIAF
jgi:hypothetical protein